MNLKPGLNPDLNLETGFQSGSNFLVKSGFESVSNPDLKSGLAIIPKVSSKIKETSTNFNFNLPHNFLKMVSLNIGRI
jgi:hypothetical protein